MSLEKRPYNIITHRGSGWPDLVSLGIFSVLTLSAVLCTLLLIFLALKSLFLGIWYYFVDANFASENGVNVYDSLGYSLKGVELLLLSPLPLFILKGIVFYIHDLMDAGKASMQTKGVFLQLKMLISALLIGILNATFVGDGIALSLTYGKMILLLPIYILLLLFYNKMSGQSDEYHRSKEYLSEKNYVFRKMAGEKLDPMSEALEIIKEFSLHRLVNWFSGLIWWIALIGSIMSSFAIGILGVLEIGRAAFFGLDVGYWFFERPAAACIGIKEAMALAVSGLEFLLLAPISIFILKGLRSYFKDMIYDGHVSKNSRENLLEVKLLLGGLLLSMMVTEMVGYAIKGVEVGVPFLSDRGVNSHFPNHTFEHVICNFLALIVMGASFFSLLSHSGEHEK